MKAFFQYVQSSYDELRHHVTWPTWPQLEQTSVVVIIASIFLALSVWFMDKVWVFLLSFL